MAKEAKDSKIASKELPLVSLSANDPFTRSAKLMRSHIFQSQLGLQTVSWVNVVWLRRMYSDTQIAFISLPIGAAKKYGLVGHLLAM